MTKADKKQSQFQAQAHASTPLCETSIISGNSTQNVYCSMGEVDEKLSVHGTTPINHDQLLKQTSAQDICPRQCPKQRPSMHMAIDENKRIPLFSVKSACLRMKKDDRKKKREDANNSNGDARKRWAQLKAVSKFSGSFAVLKNKEIAKEAEKESFLPAFMDIVVWKSINMFLVFIPFAWYSHHNNWPAVYIFWLNFLAMIPLASMLGDFTEEFALHTNQTIGGLINATFGNAVEVVVAINALLANEIQIVKASMLGSVFSNLILVLGMCFFCGGIKHKEQFFNGTMAKSNMSLVALSSIAFVVSSSANGDDENVLIISRLASILLMFMYFLLLFFQLKTHADLFHEDNDEKSAIPMWASLLGLTAVTGLVTIFSNYLVDSIDGFVEETDIGRNFVGIVILPIVGNAVEHITAVTVAMKNKMDLSMAVAIGSSTQIALFVVPLTVLVGWGIDVDMSLNFSQFDTVLYIMSIVIVSICVGGDTTNWLIGALLMVTYCILALGFFYEEQP